MLIFGTFFDTFMVKLMIKIFQNKVHGGDFGSTTYSKFNVQSWVSYLFEQ